MINVLYNYMKAVVFDNSGTLLKRYRSLKNITKNEICNHISSINIVDAKPNRALVIFQKDSYYLYKTNPKESIYNFIIKNNIKYNLSYTNDIQFKEEDILNILKKDNIGTMKEVQDSIIAMKDKVKNITLCSGSGFIMNTKTGNVEFTITAGGKLFPEVLNMINELKKRNISIYIASGDSNNSLIKLSEQLNIPKSHACGTSNSERKRDIVKKLKNKYEKVMMVGDANNDILALKEADIGVLTTEQNEEPISSELLDSADIVIDNIKEIINIEF